MFVVHTSNCHFNPARLLLDSQRSIYYDNDEDDDADLKQHECTSVTVAVLYRVSTSDVGDRHGNKLASLRCT